MNARLPAVLPLLIASLASPIDGEILATVAAIQRCLKSQNLDWNDLAAAVTAQATANPIGF